MDAHEETAVVVVPPTVPQIKDDPMPPEPVRPGEIGGYAGAGMTILTHEEGQLLMAAFDNEAYEIKPTEFGEVYVAQTHIRHRLNTVLGPGRWTIVPVATGRGGSVFFTKKDGQQETVCLRARLYIHGNFISEAVGEQKLANDRMTYATACEGAKSDALTRCAKDLSIGWECWDKRWVDNWRKANAILVQVKKRQDVSFVWRRKDADPLRGEVKNETAAEAKARAAGELISESQQSDLWALITEKYDRKTGEATAKKVFATFGFKSFKEITTDKYAAIVKAINGGGNGK